jgi:hypothetical protein
VVKKLATVQVQVEIWNKKDRAHNSKSNEKEQARLFIILSEL